MRRCRLTLPTPTLLGVFATGSLALLGCGDPCLDDGFGQSEACNADGGQSGTGTSPGTDSGNDDADGSEAADDDDESGVVSADGNDGESSDGTEGGSADDTDGTDGTDSGTDSEGETGEASTYCVDADGDGFGNPDDCTTVPAGGEQPRGTVPQADATDCDDADEHAFPGAAENDSATACMVDADEDGYGDALPTNPEVDAGSDCDDANVFTFPGAAQIEGPAACMSDEDDDGYGEQFPGPGVDAGSDCDDGDENVFLCVVWCTDGDGDGSGDPTQCVGVAPGDTPPADTVDNDDDCVDADAAVFPGAAENEPALCTADVDGDGWGDDAISQTHPAAEDGTDCHDGDQDAFPGAAEIDDPAACMRDSDGDGWGDDAAVGGVTIGRDCNDGDEAQVVCVDVAPSCAETNLGLGAQLQATAWGGDGNYTYAWDNADSLDDGTIANPVATPDEITTYTVTATDGLGNDGSDEVTIHLDDRPWVLDQNAGECLAVGFLGAASPHSFANDGTTTCTTANSDPTAFICPTVHESARITGTMIVNAPADDDDYIGFVWGWQNSDQFYLLHWKQAAQNIGGCNSAAGMTVKRFDRQQAYSAGDFTCNTSTTNATVLMTPAQTTTSGWVHGVQYGVELRYAPDQTEITVTNLGTNAVVATFVVVDDTYPTGQFGTFDYSQIRACNGPWNSSCL